MEGPLLRYDACRVDLRPFAVLDLVAEQIVEPLLTCIYATKDKNCFLHYNGRVAIPRLRSDSFQTPYLEPELRWETVLIDVIHCIMAIPATDYKHRVVTDYCRVAKSIKRLRACRLHLLPLELLLLERAPPEIVIAGATVVPREHVHRAIVEHNCVIGPRIGQFARRPHPRPSFLIEVEVKEIVEVVATLPLIASKKVETVHEGDAAGT